MGRTQSGQICVLEIRVLWPRQHNLSRLDWCFFVGVRGEIYGTGADLC